MLVYNKYNPLFCCVFKKQFVSLHPKCVIKKLDGTEIWEFRTIYNKTYYRLFAFWDKDIKTLVVATHGIVKKTQKTPKSEITKAEGIRKQYFENKNKKV